MSTRCDFYSGRGKTAQYLGSIGHDAFVEDLSDYFTGVTTREQFEGSLAKVFKVYGEIPASKGWPWPWNDSSITDTVITFDDGQVWAAHHDGCWAPINDYDNPSDIECVFPDMRSADEATMEGRLRSRLRFQANLALGPDDDLLLNVLLRATYLLSALALHLFEKDGSFWVFETFWDPRRLSSELFDLQRLVQAVNGENPAEFSALVKERRDVTAQEEWDLLRWLVETNGAVPCEKVSVLLTLDQPTYFGQPPKESWTEELGKPLWYLRVTEPEFLREGLRLLDLVLNRAPSMFSHALVRAIRDFGSLPVKGEAVADWLKAPQAELGNISLQDVCATAEGRERARKFAFELVYPD